MKKLTPDQIAKIKSVKNTFLLAELVTGVPWQAIASVWMRESGSIAAPKNRVGGQFQFDPPLTADTIDFLVNFYVLPAHREKIHQQLAKHQPIVKAQESFPDAAILAACFLRHKANAVLTPLATDEQIKDAFYGYNGRKYKSVDRSPYVMNFFDAAHWQMRIYGTVRNKQGVSIRVKDKFGNDGVPNEQLGAYTIYFQLKEMKL